MSENKKSEVNKISLFVTTCSLAIFGFQNMAKAASIEEKIAKAEQKLQRLKERKANVDQARNMINDAANAPVSDSRSADARCDKIRAAIEFIKSKSRVPGSFDGLSAGLRNQLIALRQDTIKKFKETLSGDKKKEAKNLTCDTLDVSIPEDSEVID